MTYWYVTAPTIISGKPYVPPKPVRDSGEPSRKRKREHSGSSLDLSFGKI